MGTLKTRENLVFLIILLYKITELITLHRLATLGHLMEGTQLEAPWLLEWVAEWKSLGVVLKVPMQLLVCRMLKVRGENRSRPQCSGLSL